MGASALWGLESPETECALPCIGGVGQIHNVLDSVK